MPCDGASCLATRSVSRRHRNRRDPEMKVWSPEQLRAFVEYTRDDRLAAAWLLLVTTGMRRGEVLGLAWENVDFTMLVLLSFRA